MKEYMRNGNADDIKHTLKIRLYQSCEKRRIKKNGLYC